MEAKRIVKEINPNLMTNLQLDEQAAIEDYNKDIDVVMAEVKSGEYYSHEEVVKLSERW